MGGERIHFGLTVFFLLFSALILLFFCHVNLVIIYKNGFQIFYQILFIKIKIYPFKKDKSKNPIDGVKEAKDAFDRLKKYRKISRSIFGFYYRALRLKIIDLDVLVASRSPSSTALYYSFVVQGISYILKSIERTLILQFPKNKELSIRADFFGKEPYFKTHIIIYTYLGPLVFVSILSFLKTMFSFLRRILNGNFKAKRAN